MLPSAGAGRDAGAQGFGACAARRRRPRPWPRSPFLDLAFEAVRAPARDRPVRRGGRRVGHAPPGPNSACIAGWKSGLWDASRRAMMAMGPSGRRGRRSPARKAAGAILEPQPLEPFRRSMGRTLRRSSGGRGRQLLLEELAFSAVSSMFGLRVRGLCPSTEFLMTSLYNCISSKRLRMLVVSFSSDCAAFVCRSMSGAGFSSASR